MFSTYEDWPVLLQLDGAMTRNSWEYKQNCISELSVFLTIKELRKKQSNLQGLKKILKIIYLIK